MTTPTLVILAAGGGQRFGGLKQVDAVGPGGELLMDFSVFDAAHAGFGRAVVVIRPEMTDVFDERIAPRYRRRIQVSRAYQTLDALPPGHTPPPGRKTPWGTAHAVLSAAPEAPGHFAVINADDFYGRAAFESLARHFSELGSHDETRAAIPTYAMVGFRLHDTLSSVGAVSRGICHTDEPGWLDRIREVHGLVPARGGASILNAPGSPTLAAGTLVSMNCWGFSPDFVPQLESAFNRFLREPGAEAREFYLPAVVNQLLHEKQARVRVLGGGGAWCGLTHASDRDEVRRFVQRLFDRGEYPRELWA